MATVDSQAEDKKEYTSFWDRLTAGNIDDVSDDKNSAYQRFNPKAKAAREEAESMKAGASAAAEAGIAAGKRLCRAGQPPLRRQSCTGALSAERNGIT